jgi:hypothetical protein
VQTWSVAEYILNKQSRTAEKGWPSSLLVGRTAKIIHRKEAVWRHGVASSVDVTTCHYLRLWPTTATASRKGVITGCEEVFFADYIITLTTQKYVATCHRNIYSCPSITTSQ